MDTDQPINSSEFLKGMKDCKNGVDHKSGQSDSYDRGYATQYELEQTLTESTNDEHR